MTTHTNPAATAAGTTSSDPQALRHEIEQTRANLSQNVNALGEAVAPSNIARRQADKARGAVVGVKDKVMGSAESAASTVQDRASGVGTGIGDGIGSGVGAVGSAGETARAQTQGNPLAAGMVALGAGWLLGSLLPATAKEREAATKVKGQAQPLLAQAQEVAQQAAGELKEPALQAADSVRSTAQEAAEAVRTEGRSAVQDVRSSAQDSQETLQEHQSRPDTSV